MTARQRFVAASWLVLAGICLTLVAGLAWSHVTASRQVVVPQATLCVAVVAGATSHDISVDDFKSKCASGSALIETRTTPNHVPGVVLFTLAGVCGLFAVVLFRSYPSDSAPAL